MNDYTDIIDLPHYVSKTRKHMSNYDRAAQFAPFAALTGYEQIIKEIARMVKKRITISADQKEKINRALILLNDNKDKHLKLKITYFVPDKKKDGGEYIIINGEFKKIDEHKNLLLLLDGTSILIKEIFDIEIIDYSEI